MTLYEPGSMGGVPGEVVLGDGPVVINAGRPVTTMVVVNTGDRPVQVGSHYHFAEANPSLSFDRPGAWGQRLAVPAGTSVRFEPGIDREVDLVPLAGARVVPGLRAEAGGPLDASLRGERDASLRGERDAGPRGARRG